MGFGNDPVEVDEPTEEEINDEAQEEVNEIQKASNEARRFAAQRFRGPILLQAPGLKG